MKQVIREGYLVTEIEEGDYILPDGCTIKREGNFIKVYKKKTLGFGEYRCKDCVHRIEGCAIRYYKSMVCNLKPKRLLKDGTQLYKAAGAYDKTCDNIEHRKF